MTVDLIPQDKLTLDLLAEVLAAMYRFSLKDENDVPAKVEGTGSSTPSADLGIRRQDYNTSERDLVQVEGA